MEENKDYFLCGEEICTNKFVTDALIENLKLKSELEELKKKSIVPLNNITEKEVIEWLSKNCNKEGYFKRVYSIGTEQLDVKVHKI